MVVLSSLTFIFRFLPVFLIVYYIFPSRYRNAVLFFGSVFFYATGEPLFVLLLLLLTVVNWMIGRMQYSGAHSRAFLTAAVAIDAGILVLCKALALTVSSKLLPIGLSFYIFKMISYEADLYSGVITAQPSFIDTACYFTMFPQLTEGPIMRYSSGCFENHRWRFSADSFELGLVVFVIGLGFKVLLADRLAILWNEIGKIGYESISTPLAWLGAFGYTFELYFDFWGYSLMAAGAGVMLGFPFIVNFRHPYAAHSVSEFYRDWHATLGAWFRDYIYIPMGGSRHGTAVTVRNLLVVWLLTGFWHGGTVNFLLWGLLLGVIIVLEKFVLRGAMQRVPAIGRFHVWVLIPLTWVVFAITDLKQLGVYFSRLFPFFGTFGTVDPEDFGKYSAMFWPLFAAAVLFCIPAVYKWIVDHRRNVFVLAGLTVAFWVSVNYLATTASNPFMYFSF
jgi:alginate O-acetyltransferase complex protein AlgI